MDNQRSKDPPIYTGDTDHLQGGQARNHYYEVPVEAPRAKPWYRTRACCYATLGLVAFFVVAAIATGVAVVLTMRNRDKSEGEEETPTSQSTGPSVVTVTGERETITEISWPPPTPTTSSTTSIEPSVVTVTFTASEEFTSEKPTTIIRTITQSKEDVGDIVSSILSDITVRETDFVTIVTTAQPEPPTTSETSSSSMGPSVDSEPSSSPSTKSTITSDSSSSSLASSSFSIEATSSSTETSSTTSSLPPSLSTDSHLAAVDVNMGPSKLHRRLVIWQDADGGLIARDSSQGTSVIYRITSKLDDGDLPPAAKPGTPLAAAPNQEGGIHVFYIAETKDQVVRLLQHEAGQWESQGMGPSVHERSSLAATWHESEKDTNVVVLSYLSDSKEIELQISGGKSSSKWYTASHKELSSVDVADVDGWGLALTSGVQDPGGEDDEPGPGEYAGLFLLAEGDETVQAVECSLKEGNITDCYLSKDLFAAHEGPISISSHPTCLSWSLRRPNNGAPPVVYGFLALEGEQSAASDYRYVPSVPEPSPTGGVTVYHSDMEAYEVTVEKAQAMAMTDERALFVRSGDALLELGLQNGEWALVREVDTRISEDD